MTLIDSVKDPHHVLGLDSDASTDRIRERYLQLVRQFPPERDPDQFRSINAAYKMLNDPLIRAQALLRNTRHESTTPTALQDVCDRAEQQKPRFSPSVLLALGNEDS